MDEPTAALPAAEVDRLFEVVRALSASGAAILFISHRLEEVFALCQRVTVMRDGRQVLTRGWTEPTASLVRAMVGRDWRARPAPGGHPARRRVEQACSPPGKASSSISPSTRGPGEIVALAGLVGSGRSEVARAIFGIDQSQRGLGGTVLGKPLPAGDPAGPWRPEVAFVPEDRLEEGLVMDMGIDHNVALASMGPSRAG